MKVLPTCASRHARTKTPFRFRYISAACGGDRIFQHCFACVWDSAYTRFAILVLLYDLVESTRAPHAIDRMSCRMRASVFAVFHDCNNFRCWGRPCATLIFRRGNLRGTLLEVDDVSGVQVPFALGETSAATRCRTRKHIFLSVHPDKPDPIT